MSLLHKTLTAAGIAGVALTAGLAAPSGAGIIRTFEGIVYEDIAGDGDFDQGTDVLLAGCTVSFDVGDDGSVEEDDTTDANGAFEIQTFDSGAGSLTASCSGGLTEEQAIPGGVGSISEIEFALFDPGQVFGDTFADTDGDGVQDPGEALVDGCTVTLDLGADGSVDDDTTTVDGFFFSDLGPETIRLRATCPNLAQTTANPADIVVTSGLDQGGILFGFGQAAATTTTSTTAAVAPSTTVVLARTGVGDGNGGLSLLAVGLLSAGAGFVVLAGRRARRA